MSLVKGKTTNCRVTGGLARKVELDDAQLSRIDRSTKFTPFNFYFSTLLASTTHGEMTDDLQRQSGDPNGSGDVTSPVSADPLGADVTPSNAEEWKIRTKKVYDEYLSSCPGYHGDPNDPNGSGDVASPVSADPLGADVTPSNAEEWKIRTKKVYDEYLSSCPGYHGDTSTSSEKTDHRNVCWLKVIEPAAYTLLSP